MEHSQELNTLLVRLNHLLGNLSEDDLVHATNALAKYLRCHGPFRNEPVSAVQWIDIRSIESNDYNPNNMAPPELRLLTHSLISEGFTQPLVVRQKSEGDYELVDGFHRHKICMENSTLRKRLNGHVPVVVLRGDRGRGENIAVTVRHNRARGRHHIQMMSSLVRELAQLGWSEARIAEELGMDADEILRLRQIDGLGMLFHNRNYSQAWTTAR
ncbi:ParB N-terminal domain-containing protein [Enterobacter cloacae]|uniref:IbrB-like domain-containing protein n=1 Tax=Enterobacter cloacae TaxID=550 RepID=UPI00345DD6C9